MLVLSRKPQESICIDDQIEVKVLEIRGNSVRLGISAPQEVRVHREEVFRKILAAMDESASPRRCEGLSSPSLSQCG